MRALYVTHAETVHLTYGLTRTFCGEPLDGASVPGIETTTGVSATCSRCRRIALLQPTRF